MNIKIRALQLSLAAFIVGMLSVGFSFMLPHMGKAQVVAQGEILTAIPNMATHPAALVSGSSSWIIQTVDTSGNDYGATFSATSLALGASGNPHISYDGSNGKLNYAYWTGSAWITQTVDNLTLLGYGSASLALDSFDYPHISYSDGTNVKYASWTGSAWTIQTIGDGWGETALALGASDFPHIIYSDGTYRNLIYAHWTGSAWDLHGIECSTCSLGESGVGISMSVDSDDHPHVSYFSYDTLKYAHWTGSIWEMHSDYLVKHASGTSLVLDVSDTPHISYVRGFDDESNYYLAYATWTGSGWSNYKEVDFYKGGPPSDTYLSLALDTDSNPHIAYANDYGHPYTNTLKYASWTGGAWDILAVDNTGNVGFGASLKLDSSGKPHISYIDSTNRTLKYAYCAGICRTSFSYLPVVLRNYPPLPTPTPTPGTPTPTSTPGAPTPTPTSTPWEPTHGRWVISQNGDLHGGSFYVTSNGVENLFGYIYPGGSSNCDVIFDVSGPFTISNRSFSFSEWQGTFTGSGTFSTATTASGSMNFSHVSTTCLGVYYTGGGTWTATWASP
jgi:hypothetical protein